MKKLLVFLYVVLFTLGSVGLALAIPFYYAGPSATDVDQYPPGVDVQLTATATGFVTDLNLEIEIGTPYADDVDISLSHGGTTIQVYNGVGDNYSSYIYATFDDEAATSYPANGTVNGTFKPYVALSGFDGVQLSGDWVLNISDSVVSGDGTDLVSWAIVGDYTPSNGGGAPVPEPTSMLLLGAGLVGLAGFGRKRFKK